MSHGTTTYTVTGMTCDHCALAVRMEVSSVPGVDDVDIDLASGQVVIRSDQPVDSQAVRQAVTAAGYEVAP